MLNKIEIVPGFHMTLVLLTDGADGQAFITLPDDEKQSSTLHWERNGNLVVRRQATTIEVALARLYIQQQATLVQ